MIHMRFITIKDLPYIWHYQGRSSTGTNFIVVEDQFGCVHMDELVPYTPTTMEDFQHKRTLEFYVRRSVTPDVIVKLMSLGVDLAVTTITNAQTLYHVEQLFIERRDKVEEIYRMILKERMQSKI